jgi:hypothetical protein
VPRIVPHNKELSGQNADSAVLRYPALEKVKVVTDSRGVLINKALMHKRLFR